MPETRDIFTLFQPAEIQVWLDNMQVDRAITRIQNHHTWKPDHASFTGQNHFQLLHAMRTHHMQVNGWAEIAQHFTTFPDGTIALCRPLEMAPACIKGANTGSIAMEHVGDFDAGMDAMGQAHADSIVLLNAALCRRFGLAPSVNTILYHHWFDLNTGTRTDGAGATKSCPGTAFFGGNSIAAAQTHFLPKVIAAMAALSGSTATAPAAIGSGVVTARVLKVRDRASMSGAVLDRLPRNTPMSWYAESSGSGMKWIKIDPRRERWVAKQWVG